VLTRPWHLVAAAAILAAAAYLSLGVAVVPISFADMLDPTPQQWEILRVSRIPRMASVLMAGAAMAVAGLIMQRITQNRFVSPSTSGTVEAAVLGILVATLCFAGASLTTKMLFAIATSVLGTFVFVQILESIRVREPIVVALVGIMYGGVLGAITVFIAYQRDLLQLLEIWTTGSFSSAMAGQYEPLYLVLAVGLVGYLFADRFTVVGMGRETATGLGVSYRTVLYTGLFVVSVMAAVVVVVIGVIPFLGLVVPNVVAMFLGDHVRRTLPITALAGAGFVLVCDVTGRLIRFPYEIPVSTVAGVVGSVLFVWLILRSPVARGVRA
jgi:iron complex transport system permease protein